MIRSRTVLGSALIAGVAVSSCAGFATASGSYDGHYNGTAQLVMGNPANCDAGGPISVTVADGSFHYPWQANQRFDVKISSDGRIQADLAGARGLADKRLTIVPRIEGRADGMHLVGEYGTRWCKFQYQATRS